jgi:hypothetical protein
MGILPAKQALEDLNIEGRRILKLQIRVRGIGDVNQFRPVQYIQEKNFRTGNGESSVSIQREFSY